MEKSTPKKRGPKPHKPTEESRKLVEKLAQTGIPQTMICALVDGCKTPETLKLHYSEELKRGDATACAKVAGKLFEKCMGGDTASILFWMKTRCGFRENSQPEDETTPTPIQIVFNTVDARLKSTTD